MFIILKAEWQIAYSGPVVQPFSFWACSTIPVVAITFSATICLGQDHVTPSSSSIQPMRGWRLNTPLQYSSSTWKAYSGLENLKIPWRLWKLVSWIIIEPHDIHWEGGVVGFTHTHTHTWSCMQQNSIWSAQQGCNCWGKTMLVFRWEINRPLQWFWEQHLFVLLALFIDFF